MTGYLRVLIDNVSGTVRACTVSSGGLFLASLRLWGASVFLAVCRFQSVASVQSSSVCGPASPTPVSQAHTYLSRYESLRTRATCILRTAVLQTLENCQRSVLAAQQKSSAGQSSASCPSSQHDAKTDQGGGGGGGEERGGREGVDAEGKMPSDDRSVSTFSSSSSGGGVLGGGGVGKGGRVRLLDISIYHVPFRLAGLTLKPLTTLLSERYQRGVHESYGR